MSAHTPNNFTALRLLAAFMVLFTHMFAISGRPEPAILPGLGYGNFAVSMFFIISGFLITASWQSDPSVKRFLQRRILRLWPAMAVAFGLTMLVLAPIVREQSLPELFEIKQYTKAFGNLFFYPNYRTFDAFSFTGLRYAAINGSLWTIPLEFLCYLLVMLMALCARGRLRLALLAAVAALITAFVLRGGEAAFHATKHPSTWFYLAHYGTYFFLGGLIHFHRHLLRPQWVLAALAAGIALLFVGQTVLAYLVALPLLTLWVGTQSWPVFNKADSLGDYSYGVYLYAWPTQQVVTLLLGTAAFLPLLACSALLTLALGVFSWHLIEKPALALKPRKS